MPSGANPTGAGGWDGDGTGNTENKRETITQH